MTYIRRTLIASCLACRVFLLFCPRSKQAMGAAHSPLNPKIIHDRTGLYMCAS